MMRARRISPGDSALFAALSGDYNPIHVDAAAARRLQYGETVIHGVHSLCLSLDAWAQDQDHSLVLTGLDVAFRKPVHANDVLDMSCKEKDGKLILLAKKSGNVVLKVAFTARDGEWGAPVSAPQQPPAESATTLQSEQLAAAAGNVPLMVAPVNASELFPDLVRVFGLDTLAVMLATTRVVGMKCPGMRSLYVRLSLEFGAPLQLIPELRYSVSNYDERFGFLVVAFSAGGLEGSAECCFRSAVVDQPDVKALKERVGAGQFSGQRALVIGGSRGLGEYTSKLVAAGGGEVVVGYRSGEQDAAAVAADIVANGATATTIHIDTNLPGWAKSIRLGEFTHIYYFASPRITANSGEFDQVLYESFRGVFVDAFKELLNGIADSKAKVRVFAPSSIFVTTAEPDFAEYIRAKLEMEELCVAVSKRNANLVISTPRLPRLRTDQTAGLDDDAFSDTGDALVPLIAELG
jgi:acyl dehydratase